MKPTDEERREAAKRLRGIEAVQFDDGELVDCGEVEAELGLASEPIRDLHIHGLGTLTVMPDGERIIKAVE